LAFDELQEGRAVSAMLAILGEVPAKRKQVYVLVGNEPIAACYERCQKVIEWAGEPYCQPFIPLNSLERRPSVRHDWSEQALADFARYYNRHLWRSFPIRSYQPRQDSHRPFDKLAVQGRVSLPLCSPTS
jgi:hypothetical protein